jgi:hypothetical protein
MENAMVSPRHPELSPTALRPTAPRSPESHRPLRPLELLSEVGKAKTIDRTSLINKLNQTNFTGGSVLVHFYDPHYQNHFLVTATPQPCLGKSLTCYWAEADGFKFKDAQYKAMSIILSDNRTLTLAPIALPELTATGISFDLPDRGYLLHLRRAKRHPSLHITADLTSRGLHIPGELLNFSPEGLNVRLRDSPPITIDWLHPGCDVTVHLRHEDIVVFSGSCRCLRVCEDPHQKTIALLFLDSELLDTRQEGRAKDLRKLVPQPSVVFVHPLSGKCAHLALSDVSTFSFNIIESANNGVLFRHMTIPNLMIDFSGTTRITCAARVASKMYCEKDEVLWNMEILDMTLHDYDILANVLIRSYDSNLSLSSMIDLDTFWEFMFDAGFIYQQKYHFLSKHEQEIKNTYHKLYGGHPEIARHFTYQRNGNVYGHMSMLRAYDRTWLIQHHAARSMNGARPGLAVLKQTTRYLQDVWRLPSARTEYVMCYFRPENKFPNRVFGDFFRQTADLSKCTMALFSYLFCPTLSIPAVLPVGWTLEPCDNLALARLNAYYEQQSGGILLKALGLDHSPRSSPEFEEVYKRSGFRREWQAFCLKKEGLPVAVIVVEQSDLGINLSDLLNGIKVLLMKPECTTWRILSTAIQSLTSPYRTENVPVLIYPSSFCDQARIHYEKNYAIWAYNLRHVDEFMEYIDNRFQSSRGGPKDAVGDSEPPGLHAKRN